MSVKVHYGPPGSYKTSGAVMDDFIPAAKSGRVVVTNVRGLCDRDKIESVLGELPDTFRLVYLPTTEHEDAEKNRTFLETWWHWLPHGALLLIDEAQSIWPKTWTQKKLDTLNYTGGFDASVADNRPYNWSTAWEMHRHYGWDIVMTTPAIKKIRDDIRGCAEGAFKHKNQALIGFKGWYLEAFHLADDSGVSKSDFISVRSRKIHKDVWKLYGSTATGQFSDTKAGTSLLKDPRIIFIGVLITVILCINLSRPSPKVFTQDDAGQSVKPLPDSRPKVPAPTGVVPPVPPSSGHLASGSFAKPPPLDPFAPLPQGVPLSGYTLRIAGYYGNESRDYLINASSATAEYNLRKTDLMSLGFTFIASSPCSVTLQYHGNAYLVMCLKNKATPVPHMLQVSSAD